MKTAAHLKFWANGTPPLVFINNNHTIGAPWHHLGREAEEEEGRKEEEGGLEGRGG